MRLELHPDVLNFPFLEDEPSQKVGPAQLWDFESMLKKGVAAAQNGDRDLARKLLSQATAINPASEDAWMWLASISDYPEELLAFLNRVLEINSANERAVQWRVATNSLLAKTFVQRARAANSEGDDHRAEQTLDQALAYDVECETAWFWKASFAKPDDQKLEFYDKVLRINPDNTDASNAVAEIKNARSQMALDKASEAAAAGDREKAVNVLNVLIEDEAIGVREQAWLLKATLAESDDEKLDSLQHVLDINAGNQDAQKAVGSILRNRSQVAFDEAKAAAAAGNRKKALEILHEFVKNVPESVDAWLLKSHLSSSLDEKVEALERALSIDPENAAARSGLAFLSLTFGSAEEKPELNAYETIEVTDGDESPDFRVDQQLSTKFAFDAESVAFASQPTAESVMLDESSASTTAEAALEALEAREATEDSEGDLDTVCDGVPARDYDFETEAALVQSAMDLYEPVAEFDNSQRAPVGGATNRQDAFTENPFAVERTHVSDTSKKVHEVKAGTDALVMSPLVSQDDQATGQSTGFGDTAKELMAFMCPFCSSSNDSQAFECTTCNATLTLSDIESLLSNPRANHEVIQQAVTQMEAQWNLREFDEQELTALGVGHFNLHNFESGFKYLQEASRLNPNSVMLADHVNTVAIRLDEMRRQSEIYESRPVGKTILVVDDSPTVRKLIAGKLEKSGHNVICAVDGVDALAKLDERLPDLVLLDITMPRMDGYEVCKQIRANPASRDLPVVMISGKDGFFDKVRGRVAGSTGYVTKPFGPETLMKALETYLLPDEVEVV